MAEQRLIDANALDALEDLDYDYSPVRDGSAWYRAADVWACIESEPTVDAVPVVHGRFVDAECSVCRWFGNIVETRHYNYCPNCGAKMDGDVNG